MTTFIDNIILFLNVLEQFAIRVTIFSMNIEDIISYVNKLYGGSDDDYIKNLIKNSACNEQIINPRVVVKQSLECIDRKINNDGLFEKLEYKYNLNKQFHLIC